MKVYNTQPYYNQHKNLATPVFYRPMTLYSHHPRDIAPYHLAIVALIYRTGQVRQRPAINPTAHAIQHLITAT